MVSRKTYARLISPPACNWLPILFLLFVVFPVKAQDVWLVELQGAIGPASADFVIRSLENAAEENAELVVLRIDTPGGLDLAMRDIIRSILASEVPVAGWVAPGGARAASAGTYIMYASHFAAMAQATNIGSSTPVNIGGDGGSPFPIPTMPEQPDSADDDQPEGSAPETLPGTAMERKVLNDAVAYIRGLAELRGRNAEWAEQTVVEAANLPASEALGLNVIDLMADDIDGMLSQLHGRSTTIDGQTVTLSLSEPNVITIEPDWRHEFLAMITDPNVAYILLMIGIYGLILEFYNPGMGLPGITGVICLLLGAFALQMLPINYARPGADCGGYRINDCRGVIPEFWCVRARWRHSLRTRFGDVDGHRDGGLSDFPGDNRCFCGYLGRHFSLRPGCRYRVPATTYHNRHGRHAQRSRNSQRRLRRRRSCARA